MDRYEITSKRESGFGRYDVMLAFKNSLDDAIIIEYKVYLSKKEIDLEAIMEIALLQIEEKQYAATLEAKDISFKRIRRYTFRFEGKRCLIG